MLQVSPDRFRPLGERARWGLGDCLDAVDTARRDAPVVLKRLPPLAGEERPRFDAIVRSLEPLRHGSIVPVLGHGYDGEVPFLVLEPAEGQSLRAWIDDHQRRLAWPDLAEVHALVDAVCAAVAVAHRMRALAGAPVLHGLLSPESVLLARAADGASWDVAVMDFALSTLPGVTWTPDPDGLESDPRAPEQLVDRERVTAASDVFSLGVLLASMLVPFALPARPRCWAHAVEASPGSVRPLLVAMRPDVPPPVYAELVKALSLDPSHRHADADRLRTALRRASWEPLAELPPPPRHAEPAEAPPLRRDEPSRPLMRLPSALLADLGPAPMNLRASVPTQKMFHGAVAPREATDTAVALDPPPAEDDARSFATPSPTTTVDALRAFREMAREAAPPEVTDARPMPPEEDEPTGSVEVEPTPELTDDLVLPEDDLLAERPASVPENDLFGAELAREAVAARPAARVKPAAARESTKALRLSSETFGARPSDGMLVSGVKLQSLVLKAPPRPPEEYEGTRVSVVAPVAESEAPEGGAEAETSPAFPPPSPVVDERESLPGDPWEAPERPSIAPEWAPPRPATMAPPVHEAWVEPHTVRMTLPPPTAAAPVVAPPPAAERPSSLKVVALVMVTVVAVAFALGVLAGR